MDFSEKWGTDVDAAVELALQDLKLTRDEVNVTVLEEPSRGFFGLGSKLALVRVERKVPEEKKVSEKPKQDNRLPRKEKVRPEKKKNERPERPERSERPERKPERSERPERKPENNIEAVAERKEIFEQPDVGELFRCEDHAAITFLKEVSEQMGLELTISAKANDKNVFVDIEGKDSGTIIGKRGQTLDAIQYLTSLVVNKGKDDYVRVVVDAESYRSKREKTLEMLAERLADKVIRTKRSVKLEPMNPYERKVIHATLQSNPKVTTRSEGQDPYRRVIIELK